MKIIAISRGAGSALSTPPSIRLFADSGVVLPGKPVFLPDFDTVWDVTYLPAIRVCRLGKNIAPRFASRYFDAITVAAHIIPRTIADTLADESQSTGLVELFDNSLILGRWLELNNNLIPDKISIEAEGMETIITDFQAMTAEAIACVSRYATVKMGDIIMPCSLPVQQGIEIGHRLLAHIAPDHCAIDAVIK